MTTFLNTLIFVKRIQAGQSQLDLLDDVKALGADGVEVRYEYFKDFDREAPAIREKARELGLQISLSIPDELFETDGSVNPKLPAYYAESLSLGAKRAKFNTGNFADFSGDLKAAFANIPVALKVDIENDQTAVSGHIEKFLPFLTAAKDADLPIGYVYDLGNWAYTQGDAVENAKKLTAFTDYIHFKNVKESNGQLITTEDLNDGQFDWQAIMALLPKDADQALEFPMPDNQRIAKELAILRSAQQS